MNKQTIKLLEDLIQQISIVNNPSTLDDMYPDMLADTEADSIQELVEYIDTTFDIRAEEK